MPLPPITIIEAINDSALFAPWFRDLETWRPWLVFLKSLFGLPMDEAELEVYRACTGRQDPPPGGSHEAWLVCGRRAGKSFILALIAVYLAVFVDWSRFLTPGERGVVQVLATDRRQARVIFRYALALLTRIPLLADLVDRELREAIELTNGVTIEIQAASFRGVRGYTLLAALLDELAFWRDESSANPDQEVLNALRPAMATVPGAMLLCASSPYARRGVLWDSYRRHYGKAGGPLVWQAPTRLMNPTVPQQIVDDAMEADPSSAAAEYLAEFRTDVETFISREVVDAAVVPGRRELPPVTGLTYRAFADPSGGSSDAMTLAIAHAHEGVAVIDAIREQRPPFSPETVVAEFAGLLRSYGIDTVEGDRYAGEWPRERFRVHGIQYRLAEHTKSDLYRESLPLLNSGRVELLDLPRLVSQFVGLERRTARGGRDSIDHAPGGHDDIANAVAGAVTRALRRKNSIFEQMNARPAGLRLMPIYAR